MRTPSIVKHRYRGSAITRLQPKEQRARFLYVSLNPTLKGLFKGDGRWMIGPADKGQGIRNGRFVHAFVRGWVTLFEGHDTLRPLT
jgi:hypothetical protein